MELHTLYASVRSKGKKNAARRHRREGRIPAILYGHGEDPVSITLDQGEFEKLLHAAGTDQAVVTLEVADNAEMNSPAMLRNVQYHPVRGEVLHADFVRFRLDETIQTTVSVVLKGHAEGVSEGGVIDHQLREVEVECLALDIPEELTVDISALHIGDSIHVSSLDIPEKVKLLTDPERTIVSVLAPRILEEELEEEAEVEEPVEIGAEEDAEEGAEEEGA